MTHELKLFGEVTFNEDSLKAEAGENKLPTFKLVANTGTPMLANSSFYEPIIIDMEQVKFDGKTIPIFANHNPTLRVGHTTLHHPIENNQLVVEGVASSTSQVAKEIIADAKNGFPFKVSVGARFSPERVEEGKQVVVNGKAWKGPLVIARKAKVFEISFVGLGADSKTSAKVSASQKENKMTFEDYVKKLGHDLSVINAEQKQLLEDAYASYTAKQNPTKPTEKKTEDKQEESLVAQQKELLAKQVEYHGKVSKLFAEYPDAAKFKIDNQEYDRTSFHAHALRSEMPLEKIEVSLLRATFKDPPVIHSHSVAKPIEHAQVLEVALLSSLRVPLEATNSLGKKYGLASSYKEEVIDAAMGKDFRNVTLHQLMDETIFRAGKSFHGNRKSVAFIEATMEADRLLRANPGYSTLSVTNILENVANKMILNAYSAVNVVWPMFCAVKNLTDFKPHYFYRLTTDGGYKKVGATGQLKHGTFSDQRYSLAADTYGMVLSLSRQDIINDDLNAFEQVMSQLGRLATLAIEYEVFKLLLTTSTLFQDVPNQHNLIVDELGIDGLKVAEATFDAMVDAHGKPVLVTPDRLLVGSNQKATAIQLYKDQAIRDSTISTATSQIMVQNHYANRFTPINSPMINNTYLRDMDNKALTGQSQTAWWLFADPAILAAIHVGFLNGNNVPMLESGPLSFDTLGIAWRSVSDFGVGEGDFRAVIKSTGVGS